MSLEDGNNCGPRAVVVGVGVGVVVSEDEEDDDGGKYVLIGLGGLLFVEVAVAEAAAAPLLVGLGAAGGMV